MVKPLDLSDFRAVRRALEPDDFAICDGQEQPPQDMVDEETWHSIWNLPDDVAVTTTNDYGSRLREVQSLQNTWVCLFQVLEEPPWGRLRRSPFSYVALDAYDAFQAATFNALVGYYRMAFMALRSVVENMTIALRLELEHDVAGLRQWLRGPHKAQRDFNLNSAANALTNCSKLVPLETHLARRTGNTLFARWNGKREGYVRAFFHELSRYTHASPGSTDGDLWQSNGPVFSRQAFERWVACYFATVALGVLLLRLGRSDLRAIPGDEEGTSSVQQLFERAARHLQSRATMRRPLLAIPARTWK